MKFTFHTHKDDEAINKVLKLPVFAKIKIAYSLIISNLPQSVFEISCVVSHLEVDCIC